MKKSFAFIIIACAFAAATSCTFIRINKDVFNGSGSERIVGSKDLVTRTYSVPQFTGISDLISADVVYHMTDGEPSVTVEAPDNFIDKLNFQVNDGVLMVRFDDNKNYSMGKITVNASSATLERLTISGSGDFDCADLACTGMDVNVNGAGDVTFGSIRCEGDVSVSIRGAGDIGLDGLSCRKVSVDIMGAGDVRLVGTAESASLSIKGAGDIDATRLDCQDISSSVAGVGSIKRK
ncbi:MAG: DUF2807 domain-containing protein [Bacteroidales bacterium]|nr:DUF2807 domain-containing protein [Bacteroidales bacterium]